MLFGILFLCIALIVYSLILWLLGVIGTLVYFGVKYYPDVMRLAVASIL